MEQQDYEALSEFRYQLRRFLHFSETVVHRHGLTPLQYQLMLHIRGSSGRGWATVGELAERLQIQAHGAAALVQRCEACGWVERRASSRDRRQVEVHLAAAGTELLEHLALLHATELRSLRHIFHVGRITSFNDEEVQASLLALDASLPPTVSS